MTSSVLFSDKTESLGLSLGSAARASFGFGFCDCSAACGGSCLSSSFLGKYSLTFRFLFCFSSLSLSERLRLSFGFGSSGFFCETSSLGFRSFSLSSRLRLGSLRFFFRSPCRLLCFLSLSLSFFRSLLFRSLAFFDLLLLGENGGSFLFELRFAQRNLCSEFISLLLAFIRFGQLWRSFGVYS